MKDVTIHIGVLCKVRMNHGRFYLVTNDSTIEYDTYRDARRAFNAVETSGGIYQMYSQ